MTRLYTDVLRDDPLGVPTGIEDVMRDAEVEARALYTSATELARLGTPLPVLAEAIEDLHRFLENPRESMLHRMLRRPRTQRRLDSPAGRGFSQYVNGLTGRAKQAIETQQRVITVRQEVQRLTTTYASQLPH